MLPDDLTKGKSKTRDYSARKLTSGNCCVINTLNFFLSGHMFPIDLLPDFWSELMKHLPFQYLAYFPATIFLGKVQGMALLVGLLIEFGWAIVFCVMARQLYRVGLRRYSAYGG